MHLPPASNSIVLPDSGTTTGTFDALTKASVLLPWRTLPPTVPTSLACEAITEAGFTTGPTEAAYVINDLVRPASVIASHANEVGTVGGKVRPGSKTEAFAKAVKVPVHIPLSGRTMEFDAGGKCTAGC